MSILNTLADFFSKHGSQVLAGAGAVASAYGKSSAQNRGAHTEAQIDRDVIAQRAASDYENAQQNRAKLDLDRRDEAAKLQADAWKKALTSSLALNWKPANRPEGVPNISFVGDGIGVQGRAAAEALNKAVMLKLLSGEKFDQLPPLQRFTPAPIPEASTWEKIAGFLGPSLTVAGAIAKASKSAGGGGWTYDPDAEGY